MPWIGNDGKGGGGGGSVGGDYPVDMVVKPHSHVKNKLQSTLLFILIS